MEDGVTIARAAGRAGEIVLRRRGSGKSAVHELIVNGTFAMDSVETSSERALARLPFRYEGARVLLGGLGLGYTAEELLRVGVGHLEVVEKEATLVEWAEAAVTPMLGAVAADPRVRLRVADVQEVLAGNADDRWGAILLDVDNGPDFLIHAQNAGLYSSSGIASAYQRLAPDGLLAIWCQDRTPPLAATMSEVAEPVTEHLYPVQRGERSWSYAIYTVRRDAAG